MGKQHKIEILSPKFSALLVPIALHCNKDLSSFISLGSPVLPDECSAKESVFLAHFFTIASTKAFSIKSSAYVAMKCVNLRLF